MTTNAVRSFDTAHPSRAVSRPTDDIPGSTVDVPRVTELIRELLIALGEDPYREGLLDTPTWHPWSSTPSKPASTEREDPLGTPLPERGSRVVITTGRQ
ncbi:hypothetical protein [Nonomuraea aridisoli]|uniref:hypothetical protein n=1 Tax=Nonomuraea aridisoli TaxID=2070368 RepID=UPI001C651B6D|nr:hypothetical protein [Nonomuraea aridisoli]